MTSLRDTGTVGVYGDREDALAALVRDHDYDVRTGDLSDVTAADLVVTDGAAALYELVRDGATTPVLPIAADAGVPFAPWEARRSAVKHVLIGDADVHAHPLLDVRVGDESYRALADAMLVTTEPARISEYAVHTTGRRGETTVDTVRADGVAVAAAPGSRGYGNAADGPVVAPGVDAVSVVPVAPFRVDQSNWVLSLPTTLTVERDEADVTLLVDDHDTGVVPTDTPVHVERGGTLRFVTTPETREFFD